MHRNGKSVWNTWAWTWFMYDMHGFVGTSWLKNECESNIWYGKLENVRQRTSTTWYWVSWVARSDMRSGTYSNIFPKQNRVYLFTKNEKRNRCSSETCNLFIHLINNEYGNPWCARHWSLELYESLFQRSWNTQIVAEEFLPGICGLTNPTIINTPLGTSLGTTPGGSLLVRLLYDLRR